MILHKKALGRNFIILVLCSLLPIIALGWHSLDIHSPHFNDTHEFLSKASLDYIESNYKNEYPDLVKFRKELWDATDGVFDDVFEESETRIYYPGAHVVGHYTGVSSEDYQSICKNKWDDYVLRDYNKSNFGGRWNAYWWIGQCAHLLEDTGVPAHACFIDHGIISLLPPVYHSDHFESAGEEPIPGLANTVIMELTDKPWEFLYQGMYRTRAFVGSLWKQFWLPYGEMEKYIKGSGRYGGPDNTDVFPDKFSDLGTGDNFTIMYYGQHHAVDFTASMLMAASKKLPPVITKAEVEDDCKFHLKFQENRTKTVKLKIKINGSVYDQQNSYQMQETKPDDYDKLPYESEDYIIPRSSLAASPSKVFVSITDGDSNSRRIAGSNMWRA